MASHTQTTSNPAGDSNTTTQATTSSNNSTTLLMSFLNNVSRVGNLTRALGDLIVSFVPSVSDPSVGRSLQGRS